jgi:hypothetical protein
MVATAIVLVAVAASSAPQLVAAGRAPRPRDRHPIMRMASSTVVSESKPTNPAAAATAGKPGASECSHDPNNGGGHCPPHHVAGSRGRKRLTDGQARSSHVWESF